MRGSMSLKAWPVRAALLGGWGLAVCGAAFAAAPDAARLEEGRALFRKNAVPACAVSIATSKAARWAANCNRGSPELSAAATVAEAISDR